MNVTNRRIAGRNSKGFANQARSVWGRGAVWSRREVRNTTLVWAALARTHLRPAIRLPAFRRDKPMHSERACLAAGLSATADLGAQLKGDAVTHRTPKAPCEKERRDRSRRRRARQNPATLCFYILRLRHLRSFLAVAARGEAGAGQADLLNGGSRSTLAEAPTKGENVQSQRRVPTRRDHSDA